MRKSGGWTKLFVLQSLVKIVKGFKGVLVDLKICYLMHVTDFATLLFNNCKLLVSYCVMR